MLNSSDYATNYASTIGKSLSASGAGGWGGGVLLYLGMYSDEG